MKKKIKNTEYDDVDDLLPEYDFDYSKGIKNPYYRKNRVFIEVDDEIVKTFHSPENINSILKSIVNSLQEGKVAVL